MSSCTVLIRRQPPPETLGPSASQDMLLDMVGLTVPAEEADGGYTVTAVDVVTALKCLKRKPGPWQQLATGFTRFFTLPAACCERIGG